jgi:CyaY protein
LGRIEHLRQRGAVLRFGLRRQEQSAFLPTSSQRHDGASAAYNRFEFQHVFILLVMTDAQYLMQAEALLAAVEASCDRINDASDADLDNQRVGGMITLTFPNRSQIIINLQKPLQEVWMAAKAGGFHYKFDSAWRSTREGSEFFSDLSLHASAQSGMSLIFNS